MTCRGRSCSWALYRYKEHTIVHVRRQCEPNTIVKKQKRFFFDNQNIVFPPLHHAIVPVNACVLNDWYDLK